MLISQALDDEELEQLLQCFKELNWSDGKGSARGSAKNKKSNHQAYSGQPEFQPINKLIDNLVFNKYKTHLYPSKIIGLRASVYDSKSEDQYDWHVDYAHMEGHRTDFSFTLFLSDKTKYEGGELDIETNGLTYTVKGKSGEIVFYNTGDRHRVRKVTQGTRLVVVGWISSLISNPEHRTVLGNIGGILSSLASIEDKEVVNIRTKLNDNYFRLMRIFSS